MEDEFDCGKPGVLDWFNKDSKYNKCVRKQHDILDKFALSLECEHLAFTAMEYIKMKNDGKKIEYQPEPYEFYYPKGTPVKCLGIKGPNYFLENYAFIGGKMRKYKEKFPRKDRFIPKISKN